MHRTALCTPSLHDINTKHRETRNEEAGITLTVHAGDVTCETASGRAHAFHKLTGDMVVVQHLYIGGATRWTVVAVRLTLGTSHLL